MKPVLRETLTILGLGVLAGVLLFVVYVVVAIFAT